MCLETFWQLLEIETILTVCATKPEKIWENVQEMDLSESFQFLIRRKRPSPIIMGLNRKGGATKNLNFVAVSKKAEVRL